MVIDRGGLRYKIQVTSVGLGELVKFNSELAKARKEIKKVSTAQVQAARKQTQLRKTREVARREVIKTRKEEVKLRIEEERLKITTARLRRETEGLAAATVRTATAMARLRTVTASANRAAAGAGRNFRRLNRDLATTDKRANRISFTFRRLFGILAAFAAARIAVRGLRDLVEQGVSFNAFVESAVLGIRSLLAATGQVFGPRGELLTGLEKFNATAQIADDQIIKLREDAQSTAATFRTLIETFQIALAPGLATGLDPDQIRKLTVRIAQAAAAIGLPQNQLAEEIRSLLAGTIQARTTRIATSLGITNEDIRRAKEAGTLFQFIAERFDAFGAASEEALGSLRTLLSNLKDQLDALLGAEFSEFFDELKTSLAELRGELKGDDAAEFAEELGRALSVVLDALRELGSGVGFAGVSRLLDAFNVGLRNALVVIAQLTAQLVRGLGDALRVAARLVDFVVRMGVAAGLDGVLGFFIRWVVALRVVASLSNLIVKGFRQIVGLAALLSLRTARAGRAMRAFGIAGAAAAATTGRLATVFRGVFLAGRGILRVLSRFAGPIAVVLLLADAIFDIFGKTEEEVEDAADETDRYADILQKIPPIVTAANQELEKQKKKVEELRKEAEKLEGAFDVALLTQGLGRIAARVVQLVSAGQLQVNQQLEAIERARTQNLSKQTDLQTELITQQQKLSRERGLDARTLQELVGLAQFQVDVATRAVDQERLIRTLRFQELQARKGEARERLADEREIAEAQLKSIERTIAGLSDTRRAREDQVAGEGLVTEEVNKRTRLFQKLNKLRLEERDIVGSIQDVEQIRNRETSLRVGAFIATQLPALKQSNELLELEVSLLKERTSLFLDRDVIGERRQRLREQQERLRLTRQNQRAENLASIAQKTLDREGITDSRARRQLEEAITETLKKENLERREFIRLNALIRRQFEGIRRDAIADVRLNPISSALRANPETLQSLRTADRLLRPVRNSLLELEAIAEQNAIRTQFREAATEALRVQRIFSRFERDQRTFIDSTEDRLVKLRNAVKKARTEELAIRGRVQQADAVTARRILKAVDIALRSRRGTADKAFREAFQINPDDIEKARKVFIAILKVRRQAAKTEEEIKKIEEARRVGLELLDQQLAQRLTNLAAELAVESKITAEKAKQALVLAQIAARGDPIRGTATEGRIAGLKAEAAAVAFQIRIEQDRSQKRVAAIKDQQKDIRLTKSQFEDLGTTIENEITRNTAEVERMNLSIQRTNEELDRIGEGKFGDGLRFGFEEALDSIDAFQSAVEIAGELVSGLASTLADAILEPAEAGERLEEFFRNLVATILQEIIKLAIIKPLLEAIGLAGTVKTSIDATQLLAAATALSASGTALGGAGLILNGAAANLRAAAFALATAGVAGGVGVVDGGPIRRGGQPGSAHRFASGLAQGGRPPGLDPRDTVPLWGQPGEFMMRLKAVRSYGLNVMNALNQNLVDPFQMRALAGIASHRHGRGGFQRGGSIDAGGGRGETLRVVLESEKVVNDGYNDNLARAQHALGRKPRTVADTKRR